MSHLTRRSLVRGAPRLTGALTLSGLATRSREAAVTPAARAVADAKQARRRPDAAAMAATLTPAPVTLNLGGRVVTTWAYGGTVPGPRLRATAGDVLRVGSPTTP